jgi:TolB-like protein
VNTIGCKTAWAKRVGGVLAAGVAVLTVCAALGAAQPPAAAGKADKGAKPAKAEKIAYLIIFDFACPADEEYGKKLANAIRMRLARHEDLDVMDRLSTGEASPPLPAATDQAAVIKMMNDKLAVTYAAYGTVTKDASGVRLELCMVDVRDPKKPKTSKKEFSDSSQRPEAEISKAAAEAITGQAEWVPPQYGDEEEPKNFGKPLNVNGSFDAGSTGWEKPDNAATFIEKGPPGRGNVLRLETDLDRWPYINYVRDIRMGKASPDHPPKIGKDTSYASLAGMEGVHFKSDWITATPGQRYWLATDYNGGGKIFVKGFKKTPFALDGMPESALARAGLTAEQFAKLPEAKRKQLIAEASKREPENFLRECFRWYLNLGGSGWAHLASGCPPRGGLPADVEVFHLQPYAYWPPGNYYYDNIFLYKDPRQTAPLPEERPKTPNYGKTSDVVERETAEKEKAEREKAGKE